MDGIGAVSPLRRFAPALPEGEPRAWWASMDGGRAKGAVGIDEWRESQGCGGCRWTDGGRVSSLFWIEGELVVGLWRGNEIAVGLWRGG